uniref:Major facilitator superfamily (MFS) profile domain-containing protein n=1 Tax=Arcella intermedia TaxID=1963864 RepID=A0A6B2L4Y5_9EUKA
MIGIILGVPELIIFIVAPIVGKNLYRIPYKTALLVGYFLFSLAVAGYAILPLISGKGAYIAVCVILRCFDGFAGAVIETVTFAYLINAVPSSELSYYFAWSEVWTGLGAMIGPPIGGFLYEYTGFQITFILNAVFLAIPIVPIAVYFENTTGQGEDDTEVSFSTLISLRWLWLTAISSTLAVLAFGALDSTLELHLKPFNLTPTQVGLLFLIPAFVYMIAGPICGNFQDRIGGKPLILVGFVLQAVGFCLIGPYPVGIWKSKIWIIIMGLLGIGLGGSLIIIPAVGVLSAETAYLGESVNELLSGLFPSFYALGSFIGPILGSGFGQILGIATGYGIFGGLSALMVFVLALMAIYEYFYWKKEYLSTPLINKEQEKINEETPIITSN